MDTRRLRIGQKLSWERLKEGSECADWKVEAIEATCRVLAREGNYTEAEHRLHDWMKLHAENAALLDLLARICVQQGKLDEAKRSWRAAERLDPGNDQHRAALKKLGDVQSRAGWLPLMLLSSRAIVLMLIAIIVALILFILITHKKEHHPGAHQIAGSAQSQNGSSPQTSPAQAKPSPSFSNPQ
jgi:hypothetical protein